MYSRIVIEIFRHMNRVTGGECLYVFVKGTVLLSAVDVNIAKLSNFRVSGSMIKVY